MRGLRRVFFWISLIFGLLLCRNIWASVCHREEQFVKLKGPFPTVNPIKITTTTALAFCSTECIEFPGCKTFAYLTASNTNNCHLSSSVNGLDAGAQSVVYKKDASKSVSGCASNPCLNGATCIDTCNEPYYTCDCPADKQGDNCEWNIGCYNENWHQAFDSQGTVSCSRTNNYMVGFYRSDCTSLNCLEEGVCCPVPIEYSKSAGWTCSNADWWNSFAAESWNYCAEGLFLTGFFRTGDQDLGNLEEGVCCKPVDAPWHRGECYYEDIMLSFDYHWARVRCSKPLFYIVGIRTHNCKEINCMEELHCCKMAV